MPTNPQRRSLTDRASTKRTSRYGRNPKGQDWDGVHPMKDRTNWRPISPEEAGVIRSILSQADIRRSGPLITDLDGALLANATTWILDVKVSNNGEGADLPN